MSKLLQRQPIDGRELLPNAITFAVEPNNFVGQHATDQAVIRLILEMLSDQLSQLLFKPGSVGHELPPLLARLKPIARAIARAARATASCVHF